MKGLLETCKAFIKLNKKWEENKKWVQDQI